LTLYPRPAYLLLEHDGMTHLQIEEPLIILLLGILLIGFLLINRVARSVRIPGLLGFILLGFLIRALDSVVPILSRPLLSFLDVLGKIGVIVLLFRIGLESDLMGLVGKLRSAAAVWIVRRYGWRALSRTYTISLCPFSSSGSGFPSLPPQ
jgi:hypothetical protein